MRRDEHHGGGARRKVTGAGARTARRIGRFLLLWFTPWLALVFFLVEANAETRGNTREKTVAITFDDLPHARVGEDGTDQPSIQNIEAVKYRISSV